jgi:hypothetical protein
MPVYYLLLPMVKADLVRFAKVVKAAGKRIE